MHQKSFFIVLCLMLAVLSVGAVFNNTEIAKQGIVTIVAGRDYDGDTTTGFVIGIEQGSCYVITSRRIIRSEDEWIYLWRSASETYNAALVQDLDGYGVCVLKVLGQPEGIKPLILNTTDFPEPLDSMNMVGLDGQSFLSEKELGSSAQQPGNVELLISDVRLYDGVRYLEYSSNFGQRSLGSPVLNESGRVAGVNVYSEELGIYAAVDIAHILPYLDNAGIPYKTGMTYGTKALIILAAGCLVIVLLILIIVLIITKKRYFLAGVSGIFSGKKVKLSKERIVFGRDPSGCSMVYPSDIKGISRRHCEIFYDKSKKRFMLIDLSSQGTYIDGRRMEKNKPYVLGYGVKFSLADQSQMFEIKKA